jgi:hypothetical protein
MSSIEQRLAALEANSVAFAALQARNAALEAQLEALKTSSKTVKTKAEKVEKVKDDKKNTNPTGPSEWNVFVATIRNEMAAAKGIVEEDEATFKKACKEAGITYQGVLKEASRRKAEMEGKETPVPKVKKAAKAAPKTPSPTATPAPPPIKVPAPSAPSLKPHVPARVPSEADIIEATPDYDDEMRARMKTECEEDNGWVARLIDDMACWLDPSNGEVHSYDANHTLGTYDEETGVFTAAE